MADITNRPVIFLAFANDRDDTVGYLRNLPDEARRLRDVLEPAEQAGLCEVVVRSNSTAGDIFKVFQDPRYRNRIAIFHYSGHANGYQLLLESPEGKAAAADAGGLAKFLAQQLGLQLVFLNGCSTQRQTQELHDANVSVVISTSRSIDDKVATDFANFFYQGLAGGATLRKAYQEASAAIKTTKGGELRALYFGDADKPEDHRNESGFPWNLYPREGSEYADQWNLPEVVGDALFGLPPLPEQDLPESPYRHLNRFTRKDAEVFFGRGHQIRKLYGLLTAGTQPIILFYGQSGVGKSSLLDAGLMPRLEQSCEVRYLRRRPVGLLDTLQLAFLPEASNVPIETAWLAKEEQLKKPLIVFLDQVEEFYTQPIEDLPDELDQLLRVVKATFSDPKCRPKGKLVLGFRKEWLAELEAQLVAYELPRAKVALEPLDRGGIIEVVQGPARSARLRERYGLQVDGGLAEIIADDMLKDRGSAISATLQILLSKMWTEATAANSESPQFSQELYEALEREGILLGDFFDQQLDKFKSQLPRPADSGLLLDVLALHTTDLGSANECSEERLLAQYAHVSDELPSLLRQCQDLYLLTEAASTEKESTKTMRLAHDTLAPLVRDKFDKSDKPGQRARRVLDGRSLDWKDGKTGSPLDDTDLRMVEDGTDGTRCWNGDEERLVVASRQARDRREQEKQAQERREEELKQAVLDEQRTRAEQAEKSARRIRRSLYAASVFAVVAAVVAGIAVTKWREAETAKKNVVIAKQETEQQLEKSEIAQRETELQLAQSLVSQGDLLAQSSHWTDARKLYFDAYDKFCSNKASPLLANMALLDSYIQSPPAIFTYPDEWYGRLTSLSISSDGLHVALVDGGLQLVETATGRQMWRQPRDEANDDDNVRCAVFSSDSERILSVSDTALELRDVLDGNNIWIQKLDRKIACLAFSPDGCTIVGGGSGIELWDLDGRPVWSHDSDEFIRSVKFSGDGKEVFSTARSITIWDAETGEVVRTSQVTEALINVVLSKDAQALIGSDGKVVTEQSLEPTNPFSRSFSGHEENVSQLALSPDGSRALSGSAASSNGVPIGERLSLRLWDLRLGQHRVFEYPAVVYNVAFSPSGDVAICYGDQYRSDDNLTGPTDANLKLWDVTLEPEVREIQGNGLSLSNDGLLGLSKEGAASIALWDITTGRQVWSVEHGHTKGTEDGNTVERLAISADGRWGVTLGGEGTAKLWDLTEGLGKSLTEGGLLRSVAISADGRRTVSGGIDNQIRVWDSDSGRELWHRSHDAPIANVVISPDGTLALSGGEGQIQTDSESSLILWNVDTGKKLWSQPLSSDFPTEVFSPDSEFVLIGSKTAFDEALQQSVATLKLLDAVTGKECWSQSLDNDIEAAVFSSDGRLAMLILGRWPSRLEIREVATGRRIRSFPAVFSGGTLSPDGRVAVLENVPHTMIPTRLYDFGRMERFFKLFPAVTRAEHTLRQSPNDLLALRDLGEWYAFHGIWNLAIDLLERARRGGEDVSPLTLARCYWQRSAARGDAKEKKLDLAAAHREFERSLGKKEAAEFYLKLCAKATQAELMSYSQNQAADADAQ